MKPILTMAWVLGTATLVACSSDPGSSSLDDGMDGADGVADPGLEPDGDEDGDGFTNAEEADGGSDPYDADDVPYAGGWRKGDCRDDIVPTGDAVGEVAADFALLDQYGEAVHLHDFCDRTVMLEFSGFT
jgi:hypothetical protein